MIKNAQEALFAYRAKYGKTTEGAIKHILEDIEDNIGSENGGYRHIAYSLVNESYIYSDEIIRELKVLGFYVNIDACVNGVSKEITIGF